MGWVHLLNRVRMFTQGCVPMSNTLVPVTMLHSLPCRVVAATGIAHAALPGRRPICCVAGAVGTGEHHCGMGQKRKDKITQHWLMTVVHAPAHALDIIAVIRGNHVLNAGGWPSADSGRGMLYWAGTCCVPMGSGGFGARRQLWLHACQVRGCAVDAISFTTVHHYRLPACTVGSGNGAACGLWPMAAADIWHGVHC